ncbi:hypothetical protein [Paenibacillus tyrfis]|uniref:hypothetical protein n=1 Tax=Paenibacillus tyrfis TaxID=1501230 RepID=UPI0020A07BE2|nr:hypothetical protein [Paenibacillus tyrfis]MCP1310966.1 hypothetical protein [Paenibacillus tyrfis]
MARAPKWNAFERFTKRAVWPAYAGCVWALIYAVFVRFYQAAESSREPFFWPVSSPLTCRRSTGVRVCYRL